MMKCFYVNYWLSSENVRNSSILESLSLDSAIIEVTSNLPDLLFLGASDITICDHKGYIVWRFRK